MPDDPIPPVPPHWKEGDKKPEDGPEKPEDKKEAPASA